MVSEAHNTTGFWIAYCISGLFFAAIIIMGIIATALGDETEKPGDDEMDSTKGPADSI